MISSYILVAVICVSLLAVNISVQAGLRSAMDRYLRIFLGCLALHATHAWLVRVYFPSNMRLDYLAPYGLLYGPFLYFAYQVAAGLPLKIKQLLLHALPFFIFLLSYILWLIFPSLSEHYTRILILSLYGTLSLSFFLYAMWALFFRSSSAVATRNEDVRMVSVMAIVLAFIAVVFLVFTYSGFANGYFQSRFKGAVVFLTMLSAAVILFSAIVKRVISKPHVQDKTDSAEKQVATPSVAALTPDKGEEKQEVRYQKSAIPTEQLIVYEAQLRNLVETDKVYLDDSLSLASLAQHLKIPKHHLSQVFSVRIGKNFNTYINEHRINHSIVLMRAHPEMSITEIFLGSGFTAKASFNRYFKQFQGCTPTAYRTGVR
ncbi:helix-turn-helix domain-containing protein [Parapedobacter deserti]|uniref:Helix-turn-helix domain-containing protein n=1 Tax=Parapedobacter deserti TaxID=1912957 RepID=A0ABV7JG63_9SPHI